MKTLIFTSLTATIFLACGLIPAQAQERIYRCGNEYTNKIPPGQQAKCKPLEGGNVTVVASQRNVAPARGAVSEENSSRVKADMQRARDLEARQILEAEMRRTQERQEELLKQYNNGEPDKIGPEFRNHQKYLDRVASLKSDLERNENDIAGLRRELDRFPESK